jgi:hypothetical protein
LKKIQAAVVLKDKELTEEEKEELIRNYLYKT